MKDLIEISSKVECHKNLKFNLRSAIVNNNLVYQQQAVGTALDDPAYSGEIISYAIIERAAVNLTTGANALYSLSYDVRCNGVFVPLASDAFANSLARTMDSPGLQDPLPGITTGIQYNPSVKVKKAGWKEMVSQIIKSDAAKTIGSMAWSAVQAAAMLASPSTD